MLVSTKGRYALRVMIDLAEHPTDGYIPLKLIAERQGISEKYVEAIVAVLVKGRLIAGQRGKGGGYRLAKAPDNVQALYDAFPVKRSPVEWAFRWLCNHPQVATVLSGLTSVEQVKDNLRIFDTVEPDCMSKEELELIDKVRDAYNSRIKAGCTGCAYCMPCPMGVDIPGSFSAWNNASLYGGLEKGNADYKRLEEEGKAPTQCVECGACMQVCPQHLEIPELLKKVTADLK